MRLPVLFALCSLSLTACVDGDLDEDLAEPTTDVAAFALSCPAVPLPPPINATYSLEPDETKTVSEDSYGTGGCSAWAFGFTQVTKVTASVTGSLTAANCEGTKVHAYFYKKDSAGTWSLVKTAIASGEVAGTGCIEPKVSYQVPFTRDGRVAVPQIRVYMDAQYTSCRGMYCSTTYGLPVKATGERKELGPIVL